MAPICQQYRLDINLYIGALFLCHTFKLIRIVHHLIIYNRYGKAVFEKSNYNVDDINAAWDGRYKGEMVPAGAYVYFAEMSCNDQIFSRKGTVMVVY